MQNTRPFTFKATAGSYFIFTIVSIVLAYIPIFGWAFLLNYGSEWFAGNSTVNGQKVKYQASYGETLKLVFVNTLLILITFGIYSFWAYPKIYAYIADHLSLDGLADVPATAAPAVDVQPTPESLPPAPAPTPVVNPMPPTPPVVTPTPVEGPSDQQPPQAPQPPQPPVGPTVG